jgi:hypothetical protein
VPQQSAKPAQNQPSAFKAPSLVDQLFGNAGARQMAEGVPILGQAADYGDAALNATLAPAIEPLMDLIPGHNRADDISGGDWQDRYAKGLLMQHAMDSAEHQAHPDLSLAQNIGGGILGTIAGAKFLSPVSGLMTKLAPEAGLAPRMLANAIDAGGVGGSMGYLGGQGGFADPSRISGAELGGAAGAAGGAALAPAAKIGGAIWKNTGQRLADAIKGNVEIGASGVPAAAGGGQELAPIVGRPPTVAAPASAVNAAYAKILQAIQRGGDTTGQALDRVGKLGPFGMLADANVPLQDFARSVTDAPGQGGQIARDALDLRQSGSLGNGQYSVRPASQRIGDKLAEALGGSGSQYADQEAVLVAQQKSAAGPAYAKAYAAPPVPVETLQDFASSPQFATAYDRAKAISQTEFVPQPDGTSKLQPLPPQMPQQLDWRTLDLMKQSMDDLHREAAVQGIGANAQRATSGFTQNFVAKLDSLNPDYATARAAFSGPAKSLDALQAGRAYMSEDAPAIGSQIAALAPGDQQMFRLGALQAVRDRLGSVPDTYNAAARAGANTPSSLAKLQQLFPDQQSYGDYANMLQGENTMFGTRARVLGNSQTARNQVQAADAGIDPMEHVGNAIGALHGEPGSIGKIVGALMKLGNGQGMNEHTTNAAAGILFNPNKAAFPEFAAGLSAAQRRALLAQAVAGTRPAAGAYAGQAVGNQMKPQNQAPN